MPSTDTMARAQGRVHRLGAKPLSPALDRMISAWVVPVHTISSQSVAVKSMRLPDLQRSSMSMVCLS
ncbi:hypothetical protein [Aliiroseovarius halocynthiae]|uniref:hypothetical protein n=1 Tax=Aliiroseovarius halocynthiae TaxID=985055 RepID=UPI00163DDA0B|nr:hypothetical protein [Aliiroseovarius halocynthiae]